MAGVVVAAWELESGVAATAAVAAKRRTTSNVFRIYSVLPKNTKNFSSGVTQAVWKNLRGQSWIPVLKLGTRLLREHKCSAAKIASGWPTAGPSLGLRDAPVKTARREWSSYRPPACAHAAS